MATENNMSDVSDIDIHFFDDEDSTKSTDESYNKYNYPLNDFVGSIPIKYELFYGISSIGFNINKQTMLKTYLNEPITQINKKYNLVSFDPSEIKLNTNILVSSSKSKTASKLINQLLVFLTAKINSSYEIILITKNKIYNIDPTLKSTIISKNQELFINNLIYLFKIVTFSYRYAESGF